MWVLKLKMEYGDFPIGTVAKEFDVDIYGYTLNYEKKKTHIEILSVGIFVGDQSKKEALLKFLKKQNNFIRVEEQKGFYLTVTKQQLKYEALYDPKLIRIKPNFISKDGYLIWEFASWERKHFDKLIKVARKYYGGEILKFRQEKLNAITFHQPYVNVTEKQKKAMEFAISQGYYEFPRKISLHELAAKSKQSYSTFQEHLRKAESKMIPSFKQL